MICGSSSTHKHPDVRNWLARPAKRITLHFTLTGCSWLNLVEFFSVITRPAIRRGSFPSVRQLTDTIGAFTDS